MSGPPAALAALLSLDRTVHEPVRLCVLAVLANVASADFVYLQKTLGLTGGNLSTHIAKLTQAGLVSVEKSFIDNRPRTSLSLTEKGSEALQAHAGALRLFLDQL